MTILRHLRRHLFAARPISEVGLRPHLPAPIDPVAGEGGLRDTKMNMRWSERSIARVARIADDLPGMNTHACFNAVDDRREM